VNKMTKPAWAVKKPRSSRVCLRCGHKYSSHIDVRCLKITQRIPEKIECTCRGFISNPYELELALKRERKKTLKAEDGD